MGKACLASISPTSIVAAPNNDGSVNVQYGTTSDGGATWTWQNSLYLGKPMRSNGTFDYGTNAKFLTSDGNGNYYLYDYNGTITAGGGLFKSSDGGATFTFVSAATTADKHPLSYHSANICYVFAIMPGHPNIMFYAPGFGYGPKAYAPTPLKVSFDSGLTWANIPSTFWAWQVAFGKAKPGNTYPTIFFTGNVADYPNPLNIYRCDDFNGINTTMTWIPLDNIKLLTGESSRCSGG